MCATAVTSPIDGKERLSRDQRGVLGLVGGGLTAIGLLEGAAGTLWPDVIDAFDVSKGAFGVASGIGLCLAFPILLFGGRITTRFDKRTLLAIASGVLLLASLGLTLGQGWIVLAALLACRGIGIALIDLSSNALAMEFEQETKRHVMSPLHAGFSAGIIAGAGLAWVIFTLGGEFQAVYVALAVLLFGYSAAAIRERLARPIQRRRTTTIGEALSFALYRRPDIRVLTVVTAVAFCGELLIAQWIGIYLRDELGYSESVGVRAVLLLGGAMFVGRMINVPVTARLGSQWSLFVQGVIVTIGGFLLVVTESSALTIIGCGVVGLGIAGIAPTALSLAGLALPSAPGSASGAILMGGYLGVALIPFVAGGIASVASVRVVLLAEILFGLVVMFAALRLDRWIKPDPLPA